MPHRLRLTALLALAAALALVPSAGAKTTITMSGSTSVAPLAAQLAKGYLKQYRGRVGFKLFQGGSDIGVTDVARGRVSVGNVSRDPLPSDPGGLVFNRIARDGVCIATNPNNRIANLSQSDIQSIFAGRIRNWSEVPGSSRSGPIQLVTRTQASGTQDAFQNIFMGPNLRVAGSASTKASNGLVQQTLRSNPNAIGYLDMNFTSGTHVVPYRGVPCTLRNAKSGQYAGVRNFWMVTRGAAKGEVKRWLDWIRRSSRARAIVAKRWVPLR